MNSLYTTNQQMRNKTSPVTFSLCVPLGLHKFQTQVSMIFSAKVEKTKTKCCVTSVDLHNFIIMSPATFHTASMVEQGKGGTCKDYLAYPKTDIVDMRDSSSTDELPSPSDGSSDGLSTIHDGDPLMAAGGSQVGLDGTFEEDAEMDMLDEDYDDDGSTSTPFTTGSGTTGDNRRQQPSIGIERIAPHEDHAVFLAETLALTLIVFTTIAVATCLAVTTRTEEQQAFHDTFNSYAVITETGSKSRWHGQQEAMSAFAKSVTFSTKKTVDNNETWPTITVPSELFFGQGAALLVPRYVDSFLLAPIVVNDVERSLIPTWESYSHDHSSEWIAAGIDTYNDQASISTGTNSRFQHHLADDGIEPSYIAPIWQNYPVKPEWINYNLASDPHVGGAGLINATLFSNHRGVLLMGPTLFTDESDSLLVNNNGVADASPLLTSAYPILEASLPSSANSTEDYPEGLAVGILVGLTRWSQMFSSSETNIGSFSSSKTNNGTSPHCDEQQLPPDMIAVIENICSQEQDDTHNVHHIFSLAMSYSTQHQHGTYLGPGDRHDHRFDSMGYIYTLYTGEVIDNTSHPCTLDGGSGNTYYSITLYPTSNMQESYETNHPWEYALVASAIGMILLLAVSYSYWRVRQRHRVVSIEAIRSRKVVASLFPSSVHDRIFQRTNVGKVNAGLSKDGTMITSDSTRKSQQLPPDSEVGHPTGNNDKSRIGGLPRSSSFQGSVHSTTSFFSSGTSSVLAVDSLPCNMKSRAVSAAGSSEGGSSLNRCELVDDEEDVSLNDERGIPPLRGYTHGGPNKGNSQRSLRLDDIDSITEIDDDDNVDRHKRSSARSLRLEPPMQRLRTFLSELPAYSSDNFNSNSSFRNVSGNQSRRGDGGTTGWSDDSSIYFADEPIADLFPECTVMFADISGFTAWSSVREPAQVFKLLETIYRGFDQLANKRGVFKVETIGDCYVSEA
jgi:hypothetical protein